MRARGVFHQYIATPISFFFFLYIAYRKIDNSQEETKVTVVPKLSFVFLHYGIVSKIMNIWGKKGSKIT